MSMVVPIGGDTAYLSLSLDHEWQDPDCNYVLLHITA